MSETLDITTEQINDLPLLLGIVEDMGIRRMIDARIQLSLAPHTRWWRGPTVGPPRRWRGPIVGPTRRFHGTTRGSGTMAVVPRFTQEIGGVVPPFALGAVPPVVLAPRRRGTR